MLYSGQAPGTAANRVANVTDLEPGVSEMQDTPDPSQDVPEDSAPVEKIPRPGNNLPLQLTSFVGPQATGFRLQEKPDACCLIPDAFLHLSVTLFRRTALEHGLCRLLASVVS